MSTPFIVYDASTGLIKRIGSAMAADGGAGMASAQAGAGEAVLVGVSANPETDYVDVATGTIKPRPALSLTIDKTTIAADGVDAATISGIPAGARYAILGTSLGGTVNDGTLEVTSTKKGRMEVIIEHPPAIPWRKEILAV